ITCPEPCAQAWNEPCVTSCEDSRAVVYPPPVVITFPGPILSTCPQESFVGTSLPSPIGGFPGGSYGGGSSM
ncbi:KRFA protein, partial [Podargus strigoides]|nr:KRFA protein [Podargus strigoides]